MAMKRADKGMGNFMQDRITDMGWVGMPDIMPRQRNNPIAVVALPGPPTGMVQLDAPAFQAMFAHQACGHLNRVCQRAHHWYAAIDFGRCRRGRGGRIMPAREPVK
jgi:hypothetical protein